MKNFSRQTKNEWSIVISKNEILPVDILNEAVNPDLKCIFIAIPKTGTNSVRTQITQPGIPMVPNSHLNIVQVRDLLYPYLLVSSLGRNGVYPNEEVPVDKDIRKKADNIFKSFYKFAAVRNPWARAVSLYFRNEGVKVKERLTFEEFCEHHSYASDTCSQPTLHKNQLDWLCDEKGQMIMNFVYKVEEFDSAIERIKEETEGRIRLIPKFENRNPNSRASNYQDMYNDRTRKLIMKNFEKDIDYFKYTF